MRGGVYRTTSPIEFDENDSGTAEFPITYRAFPGEAPIVKGSRLVRGAWTAYLRSIQCIDLPGQASIRELYVGDVKAVRARTPNVGDFHLMVADSKIPNKSYFIVNADDVNRHAAPGHTEVCTYAGFIQDRHLFGSYQSTTHLHTVARSRMGFNFRNDDGKGGFAANFDGVDDAVRTDLQTGVPVDYNGPYCGIRNYGMLDATYQAAGDADVGWNDVHHVMQELHDGACYMQSGYQDGTRIHHNAFHDCPTTSLHRPRADQSRDDADFQIRRGIYLDEGSTFVRCDRNLIYRVGARGLYLHQANRNTLENNVVYDTLLAFRFRQVARIERAVRAIDALTS